VPARRPDLLPPDEPTSVQATARPGDPDATVFVGDLGALRRAAAKPAAESDAVAADEQTTTLPAPGSR
jgi:hypothetical protein